MAVTYTSQIKTDKEKLFACYSLIEQFRVEHNNKIALASSDLGRYGAKIKPYAQLAKSLLKQLLAEQNRLKESIRWASYTPEQWKAVSSLSLEEQSVICLTLFGDKNVEKVKTTKTTSSELAELKAINLDNLSASSGTDPTEDFTTYTEVDPGDDITKTADRITFTALRTREDTFYVYKDKGVDHFNGNFEHLEKHTVSAWGNGAIDGGVLNTWLMANAVGDLLDLRQANANFFSYFHYSLLETGWSYYLYLEEHDGASGYEDKYKNWNINTVYFVELERDEAVGTYGTLYARICTGNYYGLGGSLVDTLSLTLHTSKKDFRYIYGLTGYEDDAIAVNATGYIELLDLQEAVDQPFRNYYPHILAH